VLGEQLMRNSSQRRIARAIFRAIEFRADLVWIIAALPLAIALSPALTWAQTPPAHSAAPSAEGPVMEADPSAQLLESGYRRLYELNFAGARTDFVAYQKARPDDPLGKASEAASYLFEQFHARGVLTSEFFVNDATFLGGVSGTAEQNNNPGFVEANSQAREQAKKLLKANPHDIHGLLAITIADGMESDYDAIIIKKQLPGLSMMRQAEAEANTLLAIDPTQQDANVALGMSNYVIGSLPSYKRAFLWFGGLHGDKLRGMDLMGSAAEHGHYLKPFAKVMLALAYEREKKPEKARELLAQLAVEFPNNAVFARELAIVNKESCCNR
jgi:tetratricopeptide (TPR) repeat protein